MALMTAADAMVGPVTMFRSAEKVGDLAEKLKGCTHNGFPICTVVPAAPDGSQPERWLFEGIILRSQLLVILSRRAFLPTLPDGSPGR